MRAIVSGFLVGATVAIIPFHTEDARELELAADTLTVRWTDASGVETVETWRVSEARVGP